MPRWRTCGSPTVRGDVRQQRHLGASDVGALAASWCRVPRADGDLVAVDARRSDSSGEPADVDQHARARRAAASSSAAASGRRRAAWRRRRARPAARAPRRPSRRGRSRTATGIMRVTPAARATMAGRRAGLRPRAAPPARCCGSRCSGRGCPPAPRGPRARSGRGLLARAAPTAAITMPGVQKPHCRPCSCAERRLHRVQLAVRRRREPLERGDRRRRRPARRAPCTTSPTRRRASTVQAPHEVVSQPMFVARRPHDVAQVVHEQQPRLDVVASAARR